MTRLPVVLRRISLGFSVTWLAGWVSSGGDLFSVLYHRSPYVCFLRMRMFAVCFLACVCVRVFAFYLVLFSLA